MKIQCMKNYIPLLILLCTQQIESLVPQEVQNNIEGHILSNSWHTLYYDVLPKVIQQNHFKNVLEIGVALGGHAESLLKHCDIDTYYGVDPFQCYDVNDGFHQDVSKYDQNKSTQTNFDYLFEWVSTIRLSPYEDRVRLIRKPSIEGSLLFENESLDCIFIDGDHRYEFVLSDLKAWFPKLRKGGMILGDDYWMQDVARAVHDYFSSVNAKVFFITSDSGYKIWAVSK